MKNLLLIIYLISTVSCNNDDCAGGSNSSSPPIYDFDIFYIEKSTGKNLLGMDKQMVLDSDIMVWTLENGDKNSIGQNFGLLDHLERGYYIRIGYYEAVLPQQTFIVEVADFKPDTIIMDYDMGEKKVKLWYQDSLLVSHDVCDTWEIPQVISYQ